jgi:hypothetical protein|tara:strand:- start:1997 stop:3202 length:1206 start_codon:yes stop_codon:yes gene_type:complete
MTDDKSLVDAYASIYNKKEKEKEQIDEAVPLLAMGAKFLAKKAAGAVGSMAKNAIGGAVKRGVGMLNPNKDKAQTEELELESVGSAIDKTLSAASDTAKVADDAVDKGSTVAKKISKRLAQTAATPVGMVKSAIKGAKKGAQAEEVTHEDVAITHLDGSTTEIIDVVTPPPLGNKEADQEALHNRLWDQVTANLTTLGEMDNTRYLVEPIEEKKKLDPVGKEDGDVDNDGDKDSSDSYLMKRRMAIKKAMKKEEVVVEGGDGDPCWDSHKMVGMKKKGGKMVPNCVKKESFNVKSPVIFSKPSEEVVEETISEEQFEKHASYTTDAHKKIAWKTFDMNLELQYENREYAQNPEKYHDSEGNPKDMEMDKPYSKRSKAARMKDPKRGINSPAFKKFMADRGM